MTKKPGGKLQETSFPNSGLNGPLHIEAGMRVITHSLAYRGARKFLVFNAALCAEISQGSRGSILGECSPRSSQQHPVANSGITIFLIHIVAPNLTRWTTACVDVYNTEECQSVSG